MCKCVAVSGVERIFQPLHIAAIGIIHQHHIEAARRCAAQLHEIVLRGADQAVLFVPVNTSRRAAKIGAVALPHFDEDQRAAILHDQVDLAEIAVKILRYQLQTLSLQKFRSPELGLRTVHCFCGKPAAMGSAGPTGRPFLN